VLNAHLPERVVHLLQHLFTGVGIHVHVGGVDAGGSLLQHLFVQLGIPFQIVYFLQVVICSALVVHIIEVARLEPIP
jgi:hypothetical protein